MTAHKRLWPEVAAALEELNGRARTALAIGPQPMGNGQTLAAFPWPTWAPAPGSWVREAHQGPRGRIHGPTWHVASNRLIEVEANLFELAPLCGRDIRIAPDGLYARGSGCRNPTFDRRGETSQGDRECWHCLRKHARIGEIGAGLVLRPWGDRGAMDYMRGALATSDPPA